MAVIEWEKKETVGIINMCSGTNQQNLEFITQINRCFDEIIDDETIHSIILTSTAEKHFCNGIDLEWLGGLFNDKDFDSMKLFLHGINKVFSRILLTPVPVIAAINGHAFGNGAMLACTCDFRFMKKDRGFFCFPEVDINIPFLPGMIKFVRKAIPEYKFNEMILSGKRVGAEELEACHAIAKASDNAETLMEDALAFARTFTKQRKIFGELKKRMHKDIIQVMETEDVEQIENLKLFL